MKRKTTLMSVLFALVAFVANAGSGIYLRGEVNGWLDGATDELKAQWEFQETADPNVFILTDKLLPAGDFKIGDAEWTDVDFGGASSAIVPGVAYGLIERSSSNLHLLGDATCSEIRFDKASRELLLTLAGEDKNYRIDFVDEAVTDLSFTRMGDAVFVLGETTLSGEFCIKSLDGAVVYGSNGENLDYGEYFMAKGGENFNLASAMACSSITLTETVDGATLKIFGNDLFKELYFRGEVNGWEAVDDWKFEYMGNGVYRLKDKVLPAGTFKIADADWSVGCNYGGPTNGSCDVVPGESLILQNKTANSEPSNVTLLSDVSCSQILFDIKTGALLINFPKCVYVYGDNTDWEWSDVNSKLESTENDGEYSGTINLKKSGGIAAYSSWQIYEKLEYNSAYVWGLVENAGPGSLFKGCTGFVFTDAGWYIVTVNLKTGEFVLVPTSDPSSVADVEAADVKVIGGAGEIRVEGAAEGVKVFALSGALLSEGETIVKVPAGIYLVSVGSKVVKVAVK